MVFFGLCLLVFLVLLCFLVVLVIVCLCVLLCLVLFWCSLVFCVCFWFLCLLLSSFLLLSLLFVSSVSVVCPSVFFGCLVLFWFLLIPSPCVCLCPCVPSLFGPFYALTVPLGFSCSWLVSSSLVWFYLLLLFVFPPWCVRLFFCVVSVLLFFLVSVFFLVFGCFVVLLVAGFFCGARCWGCVFWGWFGFWVVLVHFLWRVLGVFVFGCCGLGCFLVLCGVLWGFCGAFVACGWGWLFWGLGGCVGRVRGFGGVVVFSGWCCGGL